MDSLFVWTPVALFGTAGGAFAVAAAVLIWRTTRNEQIRFRMSALFLAEGIMMWTGIGGPMQWFVQEEHVHFIFKLHVLNDCLLLALYLPAIAVAIDSPLLKPFRDGVGMYVLATIAAALAIAVLVAPAEWQHRTVPALLNEVLPSLPDMGTKFTIQAGALNAAIFCSLVVGYVYGLVATIHAWAVAPSTISRKQRGWLAIAFAVRDVTWCVLYAAAAYLVIMGIEFTDPDTQLMMTIIGSPSYMGHMVYVFLTAYAIAIYNVLDIDLKIKKTLRHSTVTAVFLALFFIVSEVSATILSEQIGTILALIVSGILLFFLSPVQELASGLADKAMPSVQDTPQYQKFRSLQIYGAAVEESLRLGPIEGTRRFALDRLCVELQLDEQEAKELERSLIGS